jgi:phosphatidylserine synthase
VEKQKRRSKEEMQAIREEYFRKEKIHFYLAIIIPAALLILYFYSLLIKSLEPDSIWRTISPVVVIGVICLFLLTMVVNLKIWRCPVCRTSFQINHYTIERCQKCGLRFTKKDY